MNEIRFLSANGFFLLWALPLLLGCFVFESNRRRSTLRRFADRSMVARLSSSIDPVRRAWKRVFILIAFALTIAALVRPAWNPTPQTVVRRGRDVVFLLDVSRSMLAEDLAPNRLERAKLSILDAIERLQGDRVALVAYAGTAVVKCPLTLDYGFFRSMLDNVTVDSVSRGGTLIGDAVRRTLDVVFDDREKRFKDIVLITDGEDHDSFPLDAAAEAGNRGVRIIAIGLGDENTGRRIPVTDDAGTRRFLMHEGQEVWTRLDADTLRGVASSTPGGRYINVATGAMDFGEIYTRLIADSETRLLEAETIERYEERFQIFLVAAYIALSCSLLLPEQRRIG